MRLLFVLSLPYVHTFPWVKPSYFSMLNAQEKFILVLRMQYMIIISIRHYHLLYVIYIMSLYIDVNNISNACIYVHWNTIIPNQVGDKQVLEIFQTYNKQKRLIKACCILTFDRSLFILSLPFPPSPWSKRLIFRC